MADDPLDKTTSIGAELTPSGLNFNARSRLVAAIDRFCGNVVELANVPMERRLVVDRAKIEADKRLIEGLTKLALDRITTDHEFAERVLRNHFGIAFDRQANKDGVMRHALEDLRRDSAADDAGPELDPGFVNRFERHAEDAATEELREKWGRVLAAEVRRPGTVSPKVIRIVDEIDSETAQLFETVSEFRLGDAIPICLSGLLDLRTVTKLVGSGLLVDPGEGAQIRVFATLTSGDGTEISIAALLENRAIVIPRGAGFPAGNNQTVPIMRHNGMLPGIPIYLFTDEGIALARILPDRQSEALEQYLKKLRSFAKQMEIAVYQPVGFGGNWAKLFDVPAEPDTSA